MKFIVTTLLLLLIGSIQSFACSCRPLDKITQEDYEKAGAIFVGKALKVEVDKENHTKTITFQIKESLKGVSTATTVEKPVKKKKCCFFCKKKRKKQAQTGSNANTIVVETPLSGAACGLGIQEGDTWYLWANKYRNAPLSTSLCSRSLLLDGNNFENRSKRDPKRYEAERMFIGKMRN